MKTGLGVTLLALVCALAAPVAFDAMGARAQDRGKNDHGPSESVFARVLLGRVTDRGGTPMADAIVYLKNTKTLMLKTYITGADGAYRFPTLSPNVEYQVYAEFQGKRSNVKTLSAFDSRREARIDLKIDK